MKSGEKFKNDDSRLISRGDWPGEEFLHPIPIAAMVILGINDHILKGSGYLPGLITGKLSDFAGLFFFPLFLTALLNTFMFAGFRLCRGVRWNYSLTRGKLLGALFLSALIFAPLQVSSTCGKWYIRILETVDFLDLFQGFAVTKDPWDLLALFVLPFVYWFGKQKVKPVPSGRLAVLRRRMESVAQARSSMESIFRKGTQDVRAWNRNKRALKKLEKAVCELVEHPTKSSKEAVRRSLDALKI